MSLRIVCNPCATRLSGCNVCSARAGAEGPRQEEEGGPLTRVPVPDVNPEEILRQVWRVMTLKDVRVESMWRRYLQESEVREQRRKQVAVACAGSDEGQAPARERGEGSVTRGWSFSVGITTGSVRCRR